MILKLKLLLYENNIYPILGKEKEAEAMEEEQDKPLPSLKATVFSPFYILHVVWLAVLQLRFYFFLGSLNVTLEKHYTDSVTEEIDMDAGKCETELLCFNNVFFSDDDFRNTSTRISVVGRKSVQC